MVVGIGEVSYVQREEERAVFCRTSLVLQLEETPSKTPHTHCPQLVCKLQCQIFLSPFCPPQKKKGGIMLLVLSK